MKMIYTSHQLATLSLSGRFNAGGVDEFFSGYDQLDLAGKALRSLLDELAAQTTI